jgi:hypothetical protein
MERLRAQMATSDHPEMEWIVDWAAPVALGFALVCLLVR